MKYLSVCSGVEAATVAWQPLGWESIAFAEVEPFPSAVLSHHYPTVPNLGDITKYKEWNLETIELLVGGTPCQAFSVAGLRKDLKTPEETSHSSILEFLIDLNPNGLFGKTSQVSSVQTVDGILVPSSGRWLNSGMGSPTECLMLNISECPNDAEESLLSDVLETGSLHPRFFLSKIACQGILRRAEKEGKSFPICFKKRWKQHRNIQPSKPFPIWL